MDMLIHRLQEIKWDVKAKKKEKSTPINYAVGSIWLSVSSDTKKLKYNL